MSTVRFLTPLLLCVTILCTGCGTASQTDTSTTEAAADSTLYTAEEVASHATALDCWTTISGVVYDVTSYISKHPGGTRIIEGCGKDATDLFTGTNPIGRMHSAVARAALKQFAIGKIH